MNRPNYNKQSKNYTNNYNNYSNTKNDYDKNNGKNKYSNQEHNNNIKKHREYNDKSDEQDVCNETSNDIYIQKNKNGTETYIFDPYNPLNVLITTDDIYNILKTYGINSTIIKNNGIENIINNLTLYKRAFIHKSYIKRPNIENEQNNI